MKKTGLLLLLLFVTACNSYKPARKDVSVNKADKEVNDIHNATPESLNEDKIYVKKYAKQYFFARCITYSYSKEISEQILKEDVSFSVLIDIGNLWEISSELDSLAKEKSLSIKALQISDYQNKKPSIFRCLEIYESKKLDSIIQKIINSHK